MKASASSVSTSRSIESHVREALEENGLALHHGLRGESPQVAETEDRGAVRDHRDHVGPRRVVEGDGGIVRNRLHGDRDTGRIGKREVALRRHGLGRHHLELAGAPLTMELQRLLVRECGAVAADRALFVHLIFFGRFQVGLRAYAPLPPGFKASGAMLGRPEWKCLSTAGTGPSAADETRSPLC